MRLAGICICILIGLNRSATATKNNEDDEDGFSFYDEDDDDKENYELETTAEVEILFPEIGCTVNDDPFAAKLRIKGFEIPRDGLLVFRLDDGPKVATNQETKEIVVVHINNLSIGSHKLAVALVSHHHSTAVAEDQIVFQVGQLSTWVTTHVFAFGKGLSSCAVASPCSFTIQAHDATKEKTGFPPHGHTFNVKLMGPSRIFANVTEIAGKSAGIYEVEYAAAEAGVYLMEIWLEYANNSGISEDPRILHGGFIHRQLSGSPFTVLIHDDHLRRCSLNGTDEIDNPFLSSFSSLSLCNHNSVMEGRWVNHSILANRQSVSVESSALVLGQLKQLDMSWLPFYCKLRPFNRQSIEQCTLKNNLHVLLLGDSLIRTLYFDLVRFVQPQGVHGNDWKNDEASFGNMFTFVGGLPLRSDIEPLCCQEDLPASAAKMHRIKYDSTLDRIRYAIETYLKPQQKHVCVVTLGLHDISNGKVDEFLENLIQVRDILKTAPCKVIWIEHHAVHDFELDRNHFFRRSDVAMRLYSRPKLSLAMRRARNIMLEADFSIFDAFKPTAAMNEWTEDGVHYYKDGCYIGNPISQTVAQMLLNHICN